MLEPIGTSGPAVTPWTLIDWSKHAHDVLVAGRRIRYVDIGEGPAVVFVHGLGGSWQTWLENLPEVAKVGRMIAVDLPGFGDSEPVAPPAGIPELVDSVVGLLDVLSLDSVVVVGHSMGGLVALLLAGAHAERVRSLVLVSAGGVRLGTVRLAMIMQGFRLFDAAFAVRGLPESIARRPPLRRALLSAGLHDARSISPELAMEIIPRMRAAGFIPAVRSASRALDAVRPSAVTCPALLIWGRDDRILPPETARDLAAALPDARLVVVDGAGHCAMYEQPGAVNRLIVDFLDGHRLDTPLAAVSGSTSPRWSPHGIRRLADRVASFVRDIRRRGPVRLRRGDRRGRRSTT